MDFREIKDIAARFDISEKEAQRIAETVATESEFIRVWEDTDWWADDLNEMFPICLNEAGQAHISSELKRIGLDWDVSAVCSDIEQKIGFMEMRRNSGDTYDYEITNNEASGAGLCQAGYGVYAYIEITTEMVRFGKAD